jgi:hypothetical protein
MPGADREHLDDMMGTHSIDDSKASDTKALQPLQIIPQGLSYQRIIQYFAETGSNLPFQIRMQVPNKLGHIVRKAQAS